ncbi:hypothetical protein GAYE_SCF09G3155 [Galdieria yellowstonensis]|uniref:Uncharacterized protein n=1 Tax=Galdieria yellowstonensis TaxID=3028027 RepID=A0AAV9ID60_9RHOD|nr:hypothetical protein GAYE_SCF09G3155 [Galdieria yellowstonensis]
MDKVHKQGTWLRPCGWLIQSNKYLLINNWKPCFTAVTFSFNNVFFQERRRWLRKPVLGNLYASTQLEPDKRVPVVLLASTALCSRPLLNWELLEVLLGVLTVVAFFQVVTYTIEFTENDFRISRGGRLIRSYPYTQWLGWRFIPSASFPILLYFKEYNERRESEGGPLTRWHLLPVLYNPRGFVKMLQSHKPPGKQ